MLGFRPWVSFVDNPECRCSQPGARRGEAGICEPNHCRRFSRGRDDLHRWGRNGQDEAEIAGPRRRRTGRAGVRGRRPERKRSARSRKGFAGEVGRGCRPLNHSCVVRADLSQPPLGWRCDRVALQRRETSCCGSKIVFTQALPSSCIGWRLGFYSFDIIPRGGAGPRRACCGPGDWADPLAGRDNVSTLPDERRPGIARAHPSQPAKWRGRIAARPAPEVSGQGGSCALSKTGPLWRPSAFGAIMAQIHGQGSTNTGGGLPPRVLELGESAPSTAFVPPRLW